MPQPLTIPCTTIAVDTLTAMCVTDRPDLLLLDIRQGGDSCAVELQEEGVRQLFNWLGVWLHTR